VDPEPRAVAAAVAELRRCKPSAEEIHARTMAIARVHRERLFRCVDQIYAGQGLRRSFEAEWPSVFVNQLLSESADPLPGVLEAIRAAHAG
jgi:hypothetical protein